VGGQRPSRRILRTAHHKTERNAPRHRNCNHAGAKSHGPGSWMVALNFHVRYCIYNSFIPKDPNYHLTSPALLNYSFVYYQQYDSIDFTFCLFLFSNLSYKIFTFHLYLLAVYQELGNDLRRKCHLIFFFGNEWKPQPYQTNFPLVSHPLYATHPATSSNGTTLAHLRNLVSDQ
jgi:hypothetical protein